MAIKITQLDQAAPTIQFPCAYPIKVMGLAGADFRAEVVAAIELHSDKVAEHEISERSSNQGNYVSVTVTIQATGHEQLQLIFAELKRISSVKMVL